MEPQKTIIEQLTDYIKKNLGKGYPSDTIKYSLLSQGYSRISIEKALENANKVLAEKISPIKEKPQISYRIISDKNQPMTISITPKNSFWKWLKEMFVSIV